MKGVKLAAFLANLQSFDLNVPLSVAATNYPSLLSIIPIVYVYRQSDPLCIGLNLVGHIIWTLLKATSFRLGPITKNIPQNMIIERFL